MNLEQKHKLYVQINKLEGSLAYAVQHDEVVEAARIREKRYLKMKVDGDQGSR